LGDDDIILPGALSKVLEVLFSQKVDILYLNHYWFTNEYVHLETTRKELVISEFYDSLSFAMRVNVMLTFISGLVVRTGVGLELRQSLISTNLVQLSWVLPLLRDGKNFVVLDNEIVAAKGGNSGGYELINTFGNNLKEIVETILKNKPKVCDAIQNGTIVNFFPGFILELRSGSSKFVDIDPWVNLKHVFNKNWRYYFFLVPLIKLPLFLACRYNNILNIFRRLFVSYLI
jgi:abequosyltransferase